MNKSVRIVQIGFQRRQSPAVQAVRQHIQSGDASRIVCAEANIHYTAGTKDATPQPPPASLDWDLWCGPAPKIPYSPQVGHINCQETEPELPLKSPAHENVRGQTYYT